MFGWFFRKKKPQIICVHGKTPFLRHMVAADVFEKLLDKHKCGTIVCTPSAAVSIMLALGLDVPDEMRYWNSDKKWAKALELAKDMPGLRISEVPVDDKLVWVDGELAQDMDPASVTLFTGGPKEDPFYKYERTTHSVGHNGDAECWRTGAGQWCSSWHRVK